MNFKSIFKEEKERYIEEWFKLLSFPSVSASTENSDDCRACAEWLRDSLNSAGFTNARLLETETKPVVFAERAGDTEKPTVLVYGHYDVQPVDPLEKWISPPFEPEMRDGRIFARGAQDNKGQIFYVIKALETLIKRDQLNVNVKVIIEGEEECGSKALSSNLENWKELLSADILMVTDTSTVHTGAPTIIMGLRGLAYLTLTLEGPDHDLHSGVHGGVAPNPLQGLASLLSTLHNSDGSIAIEGYYDSVRAPDSLETELVTTVPFDESEYIKDTGAAPAAGETRFSPAMRNGFRPSLDINGITGGYSGEGIKTVIPSSASAKITTRLVPDQDPKESLEQIVRHLESNLQEGFKLTVSGEGFAGPGFRLDPHSKVIKTAHNVLSGISELPPVYLWEGASIPVIHDLAAAVGAEPLLVGFGSEQDNIHAPNESFSIEQFERGFIYACSILTGL